MYNVCVSFSDMLNSLDIKKKDSAVKCLEVLSTSKPDHWKSILDAGKFTHRGDNPECLGVSFDRGDAPDCSGVNSKGGFVMGVEWE